MWIFAFSSDAGCTESFPSRLCWAAGLRMAARALLQGLQIGDAAHKVDSLPTSQGEVCISPPSSPMCFSGVFHLCLPLLKGGRGSWHTWCCSSARMSGESSSLQEHNAGRPCESHGRCSVGSSLLPHILLLVAHVRCLNKRGDSGTAFESFTTKQEINRRQP